jgi:hypothetical protein
MEQKGAGINVSCIDFDGDIHTYLRKKHSSLVYCLIDPDSKPLAITWCRTPGTPTASIISFAGSGNRRNIDMRVQMQVVYII